MIPERYRHHVEDLSLLVALSIKYDDNATPSDNAPASDGIRYSQRKSSATITDNATASEKAPPQ
jgi:hypothetical protein